jgi:ABC-2 type transport system permease protein
MGLATLGMMMIAIGVFFSSLTRNQILAAIGTFCTLFLLVVLTTLAYREAAVRGRGWDEAIRFVSVLDQAHAFGTGELDIRFLALHLSATVFMLFLTVKVLEARKGF